MLMGVIVDDAAEKFYLRDQITRLREAGKPCAALQALLEDRSSNPNPVGIAFRQHFLGGNSSDKNVSCLLLDAVTFGEKTEVQKLLTAPVKRDDRTAIWLTRFLSTERLQPLLQARLSILNASTAETTDDMKKHLLNAVRLYASTSPQDHEEEQHRLAEIEKDPPKYPPLPAFLKQLDEAWEQILKETEAAWRSERRAGDYPDWDDPALLLVGETLAYVLNKGQLPRVGEPVETWVLLASPYRIDGRSGESVEVPDGLLAKLIIEKVPKGSGLLYPDCRYSGYLPLNASFQKGLRNVMRVLKRRMEWIEQEGMTFDFRWRLIPLSPEDGHQSPVLLGEIDGRSAELAFACAIRAALMNERLDSHIAITARFDEPGASHERLKHVEQVSHKILGLRAEDDVQGACAGLKAHLIGRIVLACDDPFTAKDNQVKILNWPIQIAKVGTFDDAYRELSEHCRLTDQYHYAVLWATRTWFQKECFGSGNETEPTGAYRLNEFHLRTLKPTAEQQSRSFDGLRLGQLIRGEVREALSFDGDAAWRANIVADSGIGKTSLLVYIAHQTALQRSVQIPIRIEGMTSFLESANRDALLEAAVSEVHSLLTAQIDKVSSRRSVPSRDDVKAWLDVATTRGEVVWLLDALDQMSDHTENLSRFTKVFDQCPILLTMRQEALATSPFKERTLDLQPFTTASAKAYLGDYADLFFERLPISDRGEPEEGHVLTIPLLLHLLKQLAIDLKLEPTTTRIAHRTLQSRFGIYDLALIHDGGLVDKGCRSLEHRKDLRGPRFDNKRRAIKCLKEMALLQVRAEHVDNVVTGVLYLQMTDHLDSLSSDAEDAFKQINVVTQLPAFDQHPTGGVKWRHRSFLEFFAGCALAELPDTEQQDLFQKHSRDPRWTWVFRFAIGQTHNNSLLAARPAVCSKYETPVNTKARWLLESGAPFLLWTMISQDCIEIHKSLDDLCRWLVHRDRDSWKSWNEPETSPWAERPENQRPPMTDKTAPILAKMFALGESEPSKRRNSRWLHPAWQLVVENLPPCPEGSTSATYLPGQHENGHGVESRSTQTICLAIHSQFLSEFEQRVRQAAQRNQNTTRNNWYPDDQGLLQLVPDDELCRLGVISGSQLESIRHWPVEDAGSYETRRDTFNQQLSDHGANFCLCPPIGWEHPYLDENGKARLTRECFVSGSGERKLYTLTEHYELQRTPMTFLQYEVFDPLHAQHRRVNWKRGEADTLDNHPVIKVSWYQARMLCVWLNGQGVFGQFGLPFDEDWEACCRAGRDKVREESGLPIGKPEMFSKVTGEIANIKEAGYRGTTPVGHFISNGFGLVDMHGQVFEWIQNEPYSTCRDTRDLFLSPESRRSLRGGAWDSGVWLAGASARVRYAPEIYFDTVGVRVSRIHCK